MQVGILINLHTRRSLTQSDIYQKFGMVSCDGLKEEPKTNVFSQYTSRETEENHE
jgi:hypothetical protein